MSIDIKKSHKGIFSKKAAEKGMSTQEYAKYVLNHKDTQDSKTLKQAQFARNSTKFAQFGLDDNSPENRMQRGNMNPSLLGYSDLFNNLNPLLIGTNIVANKVSDISGLRFEDAQYLKSIQPRSIQNYNSKGLNDEPAYFAFGGTNEGVRKVNRPVLEEWNSFLDYVDKKGYKGSKELDMGDHKLSQSLFDDYKKDNPNAQLDYSYVLPIQQEIKNYRDRTIEDFKTGKAKINSSAGDNYEHYMEGLSNPDGWFGSKTSSWKFPKQYLQTINNDNTMGNKEDLGLSHLKYGGDISVDKAKEILKNGTAQGHKLTDKQKRYFGYIIGKDKHAKYGIDNTGTVNAENGEVFKSTDGQIYDINNEARHEAGGVDLNNVERVLENTSTYRKDKNSQALKLSPDMIETLGGLYEKPNRAMSHARAAKYLTDKLNKKVKNFEGNLEENTSVLKDSPSNLYATNSLQFNTMNLSKLPTEGDIFDSLFQHQEMVKNIVGIQPNQKMKYGGKYIAKEGFDLPTDPYKGGKTKQGSTTPTGRNNAFISNQYGLPKNDYDNYWRKLGFDPDKYPDNRSFQKDVYSWMLDRNPEVVRDMWSQFGNTNFGKNNKIGEGYNFKNLSDDQLGNLTDAYADNLLGARSLLPPGSNTPEEPLAPVTPNGIPQPQMDLSHDPSIQVGTPTLQTKTSINRKSGFFEPLRWDDVASSLLSYTDSARIPNKYNPIDLNQVRLKQLNPEQALQRGQQDFNAVLDMGVNPSNAANVFSQKYAQDNQIIGQYDNQNAQIKNQETLYNSGVRDRQSGADQQSREQFEQKVLGSREAQRQQKLTALDDLFTRVSLNRKLNREGNLVSQLFPNFSQDATFNGNQRYFTTNSGSDGQTTLEDQLRQLGVNTRDLTQAQKLQYIKMQNSAKRKK